MLMEWCGQFDHIRVQLICLIILRFEERVAMLVRELMALLARADPDAVALLLDDYADLSESDEVFDVIMPSQPWTHEHGKCDDARYSVRYPDKFEPRDERYTGVTRSRERVVLIANGPTNHRRLGLPEEPRE
jgi:hypothetical protein